MVDKLNIPPVILSEEEKTLFVQAMVRRIRDGKSFEQLREDYAITEKEEIQIKKLLND